MDIMEHIQCIRNMNVIEDTLVSYDHNERNKLMVESTGRIMVSDLTEAQVKELGWPKWSDEDELTLIPFYLYDYLEYGQTLTSISGDKKIVTPGYNSGLPSYPDSNPNYIDNDHRFGFLAYGFYPKQEK